MSRARAWGKRKGWARIDAGDLVLRFQGLGLKNQGNWQQGNSGHGGVRQNLNDGPWGVLWDGETLARPWKGRCPVKAESLGHIGVGCGLPLGRAFGAGLRAGSGQQM